MDVLLSSKNINLKHPGSTKLLPKWVGPFKVVQQINPVAFKLALPAALSRLHPVFHASLLKAYLASGSVQPPPPLELADGADSDVYKVESLLDKRKRGRRVEYLVKWEGYGNEHNTWEPESNIRDSDLIAGYKASVVAADPEPAPRRFRRARRTRR